MGNIGEGGQATGNPLAETSRQATALVPPSNGPEPDEEAAAALAEEAWAKIQAIPKLAGEENFMRVFWYR